MPNDELRRMEVLVALLLSAIAWGAVMVVGWILTPPSTYNEPMGGLIPVCLFGFSGAWVAFNCFLVTVSAFRSPRLWPLTHVPRFLIAGLVAACLSAVVIYVGVQYMVHHPSRYMGRLGPGDRKLNEIAAGHRHRAFGFDEI